jgi:hypothetical protein
VLNNWLSILKKGLQRIVEALPKKSGKRIKRLLLFLL